MGIEQLTVDYIEHSGSDISVVNAARVSFDLRSKPLGLSGVGDGPMIPVIHDLDKRLIKYLAEHEHYSPFNHTFVTFRCSAPLFVMGQLKKHEYMPWNEISRRYVSAAPEFYRPDTWRERSEDKKQGSSDKTVETLEWQTADQDCHTYEHPMSTMSSWIWSGTVKAVAKMCKLRCTPDTQYESRVIADKISEHMYTLYPVSWSALMGTNHPRIRPMTNEERQRSKDKQNGA